MWQEVGGEGDLETAESLGSVAGAARRWGSLSEYRQGWCVWRRFHIALLNLRSVPDLRRLPHFPSCSSHEQLWVLTSCRAAFLRSWPGAVLRHLGRPVLPQQVHQRLGARDSMLAGELHPVLHASRPSCIIPSTIQHSHCLYGGDIVPDVIYSIS